MTNNKDTGIKYLLPAKTPDNIHVSLAPTDGDGDIDHPRMDVYEVTKTYIHIFLISLN